MTSNTKPRAFIGNGALSSDAFTFAFAARHSLTPCQAMYSQACQCTPAAFSQASFCSRAAALGFLLEALAPKLVKAYRANV